MKALLILVLLFASCVNSQNSQNSQSSQSSPNSPCPNVFNYEPSGSEQGRWYGVVTLSTDIILHGLWLNIVLDGKADILGNWVGDVTTKDNIDFKIENTNMKIQPGPAQSVRFFVQFNQLNKTPRLVAIRLNGREICNAATPQPAVDRPEGPLRPVEEVTARPSVYDERRPEKRPTIETARPNADERPTSSQSRPNQDLNPIYTQTPAPVYVPTSNPPIGQGGGGVKPFSIDGGSNSQNIGTQTGSNIYRPGSQTNTRPSSQTNSRPSVSSSNIDDYSDGNGGGESPEYFDGPVPTFTKPLSSNSGSNNAGRNQCGRVVRNAQPLIVNGRPTLEGQWPWQIALYQTQTVDSKYICGGTLVSPNFVITAAHCVTRKGSNRVVNKNTLTVYLGKHNLRTSVEGVQIKFVQEIKVHPQYNASSYSRDAGILRLRDSAQLTELVRPACLWPDNQSDLSNVIGKRGSVVGWGFDDKGLATEELTLVEMPVVEQETCIRSYSEFFARFTSEYTYCAGFRDGTSVCNGDSGGGMVFKIDDTWYLRGLVSLSVARQNEYRCDPTHYVVFTDLAKFLPWIKQTIASDF